MSECVKFRARVLSGFTLVELLVVFSVVALLITILLPVLGSVRSEAKRLICSTQLQQMGVAVHTFATQNRDQVPPAFSRGLPPKAGAAISWDDAISDLISRTLTQAEAAATSLPADRAADVLVCPADPVPTLISEAARSYTMIRANEDGSPPRPRGVAVEDFDTNPGTNPPFRLGTSDILDPAGTIMITELSSTPDSGFYNRQGGSSWAYVDRALIQKPAFNRSFLLHGAESDLLYNYLFVDGHVAFYDPQETIGVGQVLGASRPEGFWTRATGD